LSRQVSEQRCDDAVSAATQLCSLHGNFAENPEPRPRQRLQFRQTVELYNDIYVVTLLLIIRSCRLPPGARHSGENAFDASARVFFVLTRRDENGASFAQLVSVSMVSRLAACCLIALTLAPFTAPFRTCDLAVLLNTAPARQSPMIPPGRAALANDLSVASVPSISHIGRARLLQTSHAASSAVEEISTTATRARAIDSSGGQRGPAARTTVLRL